MGGERQPAPPTVHTRVTSVSSQSHHRSNTLKPLFIVTAVIEVGAGLALALAPAAAIQALFSTAIDSPAALVICRLAGGALLALGVASWLARDDGHVRAARGLVAGLFVYNVAAALLLAYAGIGLHLSGIALWPGVALHAVMTAWCAARVRPKKIQ